MIVDPAERDGALVLRVLDPGTRYDLRKRRILGSTPSRPSDPAKGKAL